MRAALLQASDTRTLRGLAAQSRNRVGRYKNHNQNSLRRETMRFVNTLLTLSVFCAVGTSYAQDYEPPRTASGKVRKDILRKQIAKEVARPG
jgi:hypothetical protein